MDHIRTFIVKFQPLNLKSRNHFRGFILNVDRVCASCRRSVTQPSAILAQIEIKRHAGRRVLPARWVVTGPRHGSSVRVQVQVQCEPLHYVALQRCAETC